MTRTLPILENARIASPCDKSWQAMRGDDRTRFCDACKKNVYNLIGMSDADVEALIREKEGNLCVRLYQRADGTLMTSDCPVGLHAARRKLARAVSAVAGCVAMMLTAVTFGAFGRFEWRVGDMVPFARVANWWSPPKLRFIAGKMCIPAARVSSPMAPATAAQGDLD